MEIQESPRHNTDLWPPSPGFSDLLADLVADDNTDDTSCAMTETAPTPQDRAGAHPTDSIKHTSSADSIRCATAQNHNAAMPQSALGGMAQPGPLSADLQLALLLGSGLGPPAGSWQHGVPIAANPAHLAFVAGFLPAAGSGSGVGPGAGGSHHRHHHGGEAAGSRRGRRALPRLTDLQQQLDSLTDQFKSLNQENTFLRGKLKVRCSDLAELKEDMGTACLCPSHVKRRRNLASASSKPMRLTFVSLNPSPPGV
jgi:hypothetical protein